MSNSSNTEELGIRLNADGVAEFVLNVNQGGKAVDDFGRKADGANKPLGNTTQLLNNSGKTARETAQAWRLLPAQITDVVTSLASGQPAWLVAIQQGGQIKDSFGGIGPMFRELAAAVGPVRLGLMGLAGAGAVVLLAHQQGAREAQAYNRALIMTGNAAGTTAEQMGLMAQRISAAVGTQGKAAEALALMAATGEVAGNNLAKFSELAIRMERTLDAPLEDTAQRFAELGRAPLEATLRLNRGVNYLTVSVYDQIQALVAQGMVLEAGAVAQRAYADAMAEREAKVREGLTGLAYAWEHVFDTSKKAWDMMVGAVGGRGVAAEDRIKEINAQLNQFEKDRQRAGENRAKGLWADAQARDEQKLRDEREKLNRDLVRSSERSAQDESKVAEVQRQLRDREAASIEANNAIVLAQAQAASSVRAQIAQQDLAGAEQRAARMGAVAQLELSLVQSLAMGKQAALERQRDTLQDLRNQDLVSLNDFYDRKVALERQGLQDQIQVVEAQIAAEQKGTKASLASMSAQATALAKQRDAQIGYIDAQIRAESLRKPSDGNAAKQQEARLLELQAQRAQLMSEGEVRQIELTTQRSQLEFDSARRVMELWARRNAMTEESAGLEVKADRERAAASKQANDQIIADFLQKRQALAQFSEQLRVSNAAGAVDLIADPYRRAKERAMLEIQELNRYYDEQLAGIQKKRTQAETLDPASVSGLDKDMAVLEQRKADQVLLINRRLAEDLKPEWQRMLEGWQDTTRLMRESYNDFQSGWLRAGEDAWVQYVKTGKLNIASLADFAVGEAAKFAFRSVLAKPMEQAGSFLANLIGLSGPTGGAAGGATQTAAIGAETAARATLTTNMGLAVLPLNAMASAAANASISIAALAAAGSGSSGGGLIASLFSMAGGGPSGGFGGVNGSAGTAVIPGNFAHTGAIMGASEGWTRAMPVSTWAGARRYHSGGLAHDEVPAILQRGEGVYTKGQMKNMAPLDVVAQAVGGRGGPSVTQHISIHIDARTDQAQVAQVARQAMVAAKAELMEEMARGQA
ncbi:phage tail length tape measure family protein [Paucibacter sp. B51]|uniref:phage tail length tape measure family protein n=1 Tax=Paucibacter sp. B51 TaxID=2993315 RepID=UPI0022EBC14C|nr:phage tail length tape measure family protein [Paucibacter sp. B51]